jgi:hypothetical protein
MVFCWTLQVIYGGCPAGIGDPNPKLPSQKPEAEKWSQKKQKLKKVIVVTTRYYSFVMCVVEIIPSL